MRNKSYCKRRYRRCFSLMEIMLVFALLSLVGAIGGVQIVRVIREQAFLTDVQRVQEMLSTAQQVAFSANVDATVCFSRLPDGSLCMRISSDPPLNLPFFSNVKKSTKALAAIDQITFRERDVTQGRPLCVRFFQFGNEEGLLVLTGKEKRRYIAVSPVPAPLVARSSIPVLNRTDPSEKLYPEHPFLDKEV